MLRGLEIRKATVELSRGIAARSLVGLQRASGDRKLSNRPTPSSTTLQNQLVEALSKGDRNRADQLTRDLQSNRKQVD